MLIRKLGKLLRGNATPFQLLAACVLGALLGFMPGWTQAPGLIVSVTLLLIILNANLGLAALVAGISKLLSLALMPLSFAAGRFLLDGPTSGFFTQMINAPVLALFGFEYYATSGGLLVGLIFGLLVGYIVVRIITTFRATMSKLGTDSERFQKWISKKWVKFTIWLLAGKGAKTGYADMLKKKVGNPIRPLGVVFAVLVAVVGVLVQMFASGPIVTAALTHGLEQANGATVDLQSADLDLKSNRLTIEGLAMADPNQLETDLFRAVKLEADVSASSLLRKRLKLDRVVITDASHGEQRATPGKTIGKPPTPTPPPEDQPADTKTIDDYLKDAKVWKERLAQVRRWLEKLSGPESESPDGTPSEQIETLRERLEREIRELGYTRVRASHLIEGSPTFTVTEIVAEKVRVPNLKDETLAITGHNLSTHPALLGAVPELKIESSAGTIAFGTRLGRYDTTPGTNTLTVSYKGLPTDEVAKNLVVEGQNPVKGGTIDLAAAGSWTTVGGVSIDLPLQAVLHNVTFALPSAGETKVEEMTIPIQLTGAIDNPRVNVDDRLLGDALVKAGLSRAKDELGTRAQDAINKELGDKIGKDAGGLLNNILGGKKD